MKSQRLTVQLIKAMPLKTRSYKVWDSKLPALGVQIFPDGCRYYITSLSVGNKEIAVVGDLSLTKVRQHAQALQVSLLEQESQKKPIRMIRFDDFVNNEWIPYVCERWKPETQDKAHTALRHSLLAEFGRYPINRINSTHVLRWFDARSEHYAGGANRNLDVLRSIFKYAVKVGYCVAVPSEGIK
ncbi:phage integrase central domain-containing protein [Vibrio mediterranei]